MAETFYFGQLGEEDLYLGHGTFSTPLPNGAIVSLNKVGIHSYLGAAVVSVTSFAGADAGEKIVAAIAALPSEGGIVDARGLYGTQYINQNLFSGVTKPITLLIGPADFHLSVTQTLAATGNQRIIGISPGGEWPEVSANSNLTWDGANGGTVLLLDRVRDSFFSDFAIQPGTGTIGIGIRIDHVNTPSGGTLSTNNHFSRLLIGTSTCAVQVGNTSVANNDLHVFEDVLINGSGTYGYYLNQSQSKFIRILRGSVGGRSSAVYTNQASFEAHGLNLSINAIDFDLGQPDDVIMILNCQSEQTTQFLNDHVGNSGVNWALNIIGCRAEPLTHGGVDFLKYNKHGPVNLIGNDFADGLTTAAVRFDFSSPNGTTVNSRGNIFPNANVWAGAVLNINRVSIGDNYIGPGDIPGQMPNYFGANGLSITTGPISSGTYTPTLVNGTNVTSSTAFTAQYLRVGNVVQVSGKIEITATAAGTTNIRISLPIASNFTGEEDGCGVGADPNAVSARIFANAANDQLIFETAVNAGGGRSWSWTATYVLK